MVKQVDIYIFTVFKRFARCQNININIIIFDRQRIMQFIRRELSKDDGPVKPSIEGRPTHVNQKLPKPERKIFSLSPLEKTKFVKFLCRASCFASVYLEETAEFSRYIWKGIGTGSSLKI